MMFRDVQDFFRARRFKKLSRSREQALKAYAKETYKLRKRADDAYIAIGRLASVMVRAGFTDEELSRANWEVREKCEERMDH